jgi:hypothetical protein
MDVGKPFVRDMFHPERQLSAPLYQRAYVWKKEKQWMPLWADICKQAQRLLDGHDDYVPHFLGAVVLLQLRSQTGRPDARLIVDGQQRLTTLQLLLRAFFDVLPDRDEYAEYRRKIERQLFNEFAYGEDRFKLRPTNKDREPYRAVMTAGSPGALRKWPWTHPNLFDSQIVHCYLYFHEAIAGWIELDGPESAKRCDRLLSAVGEKLRLVAIDIDKDDDPQMVFETLNARGTRLQASDLVKNLLFRRVLNEGVDADVMYDRYWRTFEEEGGGGWWDTEVGRGLQRQTRIDLYLHHYLSLERKDEVDARELFREYQKFMEYAGERPAEQYMAEFRRYADHFRRFLTLQDESREGRFFHHLAIMDTTAAFPLLLWLYEWTRDRQDVAEARTAILGDLESFLVRRMICRLQPKSYGRLFLNILKALSQSGDLSRQAFGKLLLDEKGDSGRWPDNTEFGKAWLDNAVYGNIAQARLQMVLRELDSALQQRKTEEVQLPKNLTIEHVLPQDWQEFWPLPHREGENTEDLLQRRQTRDHLKHTIGNLTLLTQSLNSDVSNGPFAQKKKAILQHSAINLNRAFLTDATSWDEDSILRRGKDLFAVACRVWPFPA